MMNKALVAMHAMQLIYTTIDNLDNAKKIATELVNSQLAACVNIIPQVILVYEWQGKIEESVELSLVIKTTVDKKTALVSKLEAIHPYDLPAIIAIDASCSDAFHQFIAS